MRARLRHHPWRWTLGLGAVLLGGLLALRAALPATVDAVVPTRRDVVRTLVLVGRVRPPARVGVGVTLTGTVREVPVREGDRVGPGDLLVALDDREARAAVAEAGAALAEVEARSRATVEQAETEAAQAARDLDRIRTVFAQGALTRQRVEQAEQRAADARSRLEAARIQAGPGAGGEVARARAALEAARARHALTRVLAPGDGVVLARDVEPGDAVQPGRSLLEVALDGPTELVVFPSEENLGQLHPGAPARASADAWPRRTFAARVSSIAPSVDPAQGTVEVRLAVDDPPDDLLPDMTVSVNIEVGRREHALVLPEEAVRGLGTDAPWVAVVRDGVLVRQPVEVGLRGERWVEILSGIGPSQAVVPPDGGPDPGRRVRLRPTREE